jgi:hypothetical protein
MSTQAVHAHAKPFSWSYSKLKNYETCPKRHYHCDVVKDVKEEESENLKWGNYVHDGFARRLKKKVPLPEGMGQWESWCERIELNADKILVEQKLAIDAHFAPVGWRGDAAWYRGVADVIKFMGDVALVIDWKTGKILDDSQQLALMAACVFAHHPKLIAIRAEFIWLKEGCTSGTTIKRGDLAGMWQAIWPRIETLRVAHENNAYPANPGKLCRDWCPVVKCPHHGERY